MSTFGEIVEPTSRAAWEDWDDIIPEHSILNLQWERNPPVPKEIETFVLFEGKYLSDCVKMLIQKNFELIDSVTQVNLQLFKTKSADTYICTLKDYNLVLSSETVELLRPYLDVTRDVLAVQSKPLNEYQVTKPSQDSVIRMICTTKALTKSFNINIPTLEQPNIITGVSAGVITLREHLDQAGAALVCYMECPEEYYIMDNMVNLLEMLNIAQKCTSRPSSVLDSNLYI